MVPIKQNLKKKEKYCDRAENQEMYEVYKFHEIVLSDAFGYGGR